MTKKVEPGVPAKYNYQAVRYTNSGAGPGAPLVLTSDPWSFLKAKIAERIPKSRGRNRDCLERGHYYAQLAESFYHASGLIPLPARATLAYYGVLNLVKCFISSKGFLLGAGPEIHGLVSGTNDFEIEVTAHPKHSTAIFHEFCRALGTPVSGRHPITLQDIFAQVPEIHEMAFSLGCLPNNKRLFVPVEIAFLVNREHKRLFTETRYEKKNEARIPNLDHSFFSGLRKAYFKPLGESDGWIVYRSKRRRALSKENWPRVYLNVIRDYAALSIWSILTRDGHRYYCNLSGPQYHQLAYAVMLMFYLGTVTRYEPEETGKLLQGKFAPLVAEALSVCPKQVLYCLVSLITESTCVIPFAKIE